MADTNKPAGGGDIDPLTGFGTTGHSWDGIRELNRPLPRWWLWTFYATIIFAVGYVIAYPSIPLLKGGTTGVLGYSTRAEVEADIIAAQAAQGGSLTQISSLSLEDIRANADLARFAASGGRSAFLVNCVQCHGSGAAGSPGYANLNDDEWLWGGSLEEIHQTIAHGVRSADPDTHYSEMPAFGADDLLPKPEIVAATEYVLALSGQDHDAALAKEGEAVFANNCASCHGETGEGNKDFGAPALNDAIWLYSGDRAGILAQIAKPRAGVMPAWASRLDETTIKQLTIYVHALGGGQAATATP